MTNIVSKFFSGNLNFSKLNVIFFITLLSITDAFTSDFDEGIDYRVIENSEISKGKFDNQVIEFFGYFCPHCKNFSPSLKKWEKSLSETVSFTQLHVPFRDINHQRLFFTLREINAEDKLHLKIFDAVQVQRLPLSDYLNILSWVENHGVNEEIFEKAWNSKNVRENMSLATKLMKDFKVDGVPLLVVNGKYLTSPSMVGGSHKRALKVVDFLLDK